MEAELTDGCFRAFGTFNETVVVLWQRDHAWMYGYVLGGSARVPNDGLSIRDRWMGSPWRAGSLHAGETHCDAQR